MSPCAKYQLPKGPLGLKGPVKRPKPGSLPLRGDLAHIALAETYLAAHYVIPECARVGDEGARLRLATDEDSEIVATLDAGAKIEVLDIAGRWVWACLGPQGPSGYLEIDRLAGGAS